MQRISAGPILATVFVAVALVGTGVLVWLLVFGRASVRGERWVIPDGFSALVRVQYERSQCAALTTEDSVTELSVPDDGVLCTSSAFPFGEVNELFVRVHRDGSRTAMRVPDEVDTIGYTTQTKQRFAFVGTIGEQRQARDQMVLILRGETPNIRRP